MSKRNNTAKGPGTKNATSKKNTARSERKAGAPEVVVEQKDKGGQPRFFETAERFREAWIKYFKWADENPWYKNDFVKSGDFAGKIVQTPTQRPYTIQSFQAYYGLSGDYCDSLIRSLKDSKAIDYQEYLSVYSWAKNKCSSQRIEGGMVGVFNANIVARIDNLVEKTDVTTGGEKLPASQPVQISPEDVAKALENLKNKF